MVLRFLDAITFPISKILESLFDAAEYRVAKKAALRTTKQRTLDSESRSQEETRNAYAFQNGRASAAK
jgi:hypothetical protein